MFENVNWMSFAGKPAIFGVIGLFVGYYFSHRPYVAIAAAILFALASFAINF